MQATVQGGSSICSRSLVRSATGSPERSPRRPTVAARSMESATSSMPARTGATSCCSMSTSTATTDPALARVTRPAGPAPSHSSLLFRGATGQWVRARRGVLTEEPTE